MSTPTVEREGSEFIEYPGFTVEYRDSSHRYWIWHPERSPIPSVTGALRVIDKPQLVKWAERTGVESALSMERAGQLRYDNGASVPIAQAPKFIRDAGIGADAQKKAGGSRGTAIHEALRIYCEDGEAPGLGDFHPDNRGYVQGLCKWLLEAEPEPILTEQIVGSWEHGFAGRFDLLARIGGRTLMCDLKTAKHPYPEHSLQLGAYSLALEECFPDDEEKRAEQGLIVLVGADGEFSTHVGCADPEDFLDVLACHKAVERVRNAMRALR